VIAVDPGQINIATYLSKIVDSDSDFRVFKNLNSANTFMGWYTGKDYLDNAKIENSYAFEKSRREENIAYGDSIKSMSAVSLAIPGKAQEYVTRSYSNLKVQYDELMSTDRAVRRFREFSARQETISDSVPASPRRDCRSLRRSEET